MDHDTAETQDTGLINAIALCCENGLTRVKEVPVGAPFIAC